MSFMRVCDKECIDSVLLEAKNFQANALRKGDCMYTSEEGDHVLFVDSDGSTPTTEEACDEVDEQWIENIRGGPVDILLNAMRAFNDANGGAMKMFFTVIVQGFYLIKNRLVTTMGV